MEEEISLEELEQIFLDSLDPLKIEEVTSFINEQIQNPLFINALFNLSVFTRNEKVLLQCSIQCCNAIKMHWKNFLEEDQQKFFDQLLYLIDNINFPSYFPRCITYIVSHSSIFYSRIALYIKNALESPLFEESMNENSIQFSSFLKIFIDTYFTCPDVQEIDLSPLMVHIMENPNSFSPEIRKYCLTFLTVSIYVINKSKNQDITLNLEKYSLCYHLFVNMPYEDIFVTYWTSFFDFIDADVLTQEEINDVFQKAYQIIIDPEVDLMHKILILSIYSSKLQDFQRDFVMNLFEFCFNTCTQILQNDGVFPVDQLSLFEPFLDIYYVDEQGEEIIDQEFISLLYSFIKEQIMAENELTATTSLAILTIFMTNDSTETIEKDLEFFITFINQCLDSDIPILQEMSCYLLQNSQLIKSKSMKYNFSKFVPSFIQKVVVLITSENTFKNVRFKAIDSLFSLYEIETSSKDNYNSPFYGGLYNQIIQSQNLFSKDDFDSFVSCQTISIFLDPTITNEQLIEAYQFVNEVLTTSDDDTLLSKCFILFNSILFSNFQLKRRIEFDYLFTLPIIESILTQKNDSTVLIKSVLRFINNIIFFYKKNAFDFEQICIKLLVPFISTINETSLKIELVNIISNASKLTSNVDGANSIAVVIFDLIDSDRLQKIKDVFLYSKAIIKLLNTDNLYHLFEVSMSFIYHNDDKSLIEESILIVNKIVKFYLSVEGEKDTSIIDAVYKLIHDFIEKELKYQAEKNPLKAYYDLISSFCELISTIWKYENENNTLIFGFLLEYIQSCLPHYANIKKYKIDSVIGCLAGGIQSGILTSQELFANLTELIPNLASPQISTLNNFDLKQNICFLLNQMLKLESSVVFPYVDQFLSTWFQECLELIKNEDEDADDASILLNNISFLFFEIYGKSKPAFPSSQANLLLITSIENFPPLNEKCFEYTKQLLDSILSNFFTENDLAVFDSMIHSTDNDLDMLKIYSSFALAFVRLLNLDKENLYEERQIDEQTIEQIQNIINFLVSKDRQIESILTQNNSE